MLQRLSRLSLKKSTKKTTPWRTILIYHTTRNSFQNRWLRFNYSTPRHISDPEQNNGEWFMWNNQITQGPTWTFQETWKPNSWKQDQKVPILIRCKHKMFSEPSKRTRGPTIPRLLERTNRRHPEASLAESHRLPLKTKKGERKRSKQN